MSAMSGRRQAKLPLGLSRRGFLRAGSLSSLAWFSARAIGLAESAEDRPKGKGARSLILLWLNGGPSQLETFDPHPGGPIGGPTQAIETSVPGVQFAEHLPRSAERMDKLAVVRSMVTREGDHERARYLMTTGYRPNPTVAHPSIGSILCAELPATGTRIPRYIAIGSDGRHTRGGVLGEEYDAYRIGDPLHPPPNVRARVGADRLGRRIESLDVVESALGSRNEPSPHRAEIDRALAMMNAEQLDAFDVVSEPATVLAEYGDTEFGRGCLAARRLVAAGVRCVEVQLNGWDTHVDNFTNHAELAAILDPALAALIGDLTDREMLAETLVVVAGEFGRTPKINPLDGRDHWPTGFSVVLGGGGIRGGQAIGATDPAGSKEVESPFGVEDLFATVLAAFGIEPAKEYLTPIGRPIKLSEGTVHRQLLPG